MDYEGRHRTSGEPSQVAFTGRAVLRTVVQVGIPSVLLLAVVIPQIIEIILEDAGETMPPSVRAWLLAASGFIVTFAGILTKIMSLPSVNDWLDRLHLSAEPLDKP